MNGKDLPLLEAESTSKSGKIALGELCNFQTGKLDSNQANENGKFPFFTCSPEILRINSYSFDCEAILLAGNNAEGNFNVKYYKGKFDAYQRTYVITIKDESRLGYKYLYFWLSFKLRLLREFSQGTATRFLTKEILSAMEITLPSLVTQKQIGETLFSLVSKMELNVLMNENLQQIGQTIFGRWLVDFEFSDDEGKSYKSSGGRMIDSDIGKIPAGWQVCRLGDVAELMMGISPKGTSYNLVGEGMPLLNGAADFRGKMITPKKFTRDPIRTCKKGDLLLCIRATIGNLVFADAQYCLGRGVAALTPRNEILKGFVFFQMQRSLRKLVSNAAGSVIVGLSKQDIVDTTVVIPEDSVLNRFHEVTSKLLDEMANQVQTNKELLVIRDVLLRRLFSSESELIP